MVKKASRKKKKEAVPLEDAPAQTADVGALEEKLEELEKDLEAALAESADAADRAVRTLAEFDNYRKRSRRERDEAAGQGAARVLAELLTLADDFDRALEHAGADVPAPFLDGMKLVARGLHDLLDRNGVSRIESRGEPFDPEIHEALSSAPSAEAEPNTVLHEIQPGYRMGERVLRPAKVVVAARKEPASAAPEAEAESGETAEG